MGWQPVVENEQVLVIRITQSSSREGDELNRKVKSPKGRSDSLVGINRKGF
jgi:hypothetical protein